MFDDLRHASRTLRRRPLLATVITLTLAVGIGGAAAVFSVVDAVVLRPLPFVDAERLLRVWEINPAGDRHSVSDAAFVTLAAQSTTMQPAAAYLDEPAAAVLAGGGEPQQVRRAVVSARFAEVLGVAASVGRTFTADEDRPGAPARSVLLSDGLWRSRFNGASEVIGRAVSIDGEPFTVTGVMPPGFDFPGGADVWVPLGADPARDGKSLAVIARLAAGATLQQATVDLTELTRRWAAANPEANAGWRAEAVPFRDWMISPRFRDATWMLLAAVTVLLLLACANVANLLVALAVSRQGEMRVRLALGGGRARIVRQLLTESALLATAGTVTGVLLAVWSIDAIRGLGAEMLPRLEQVRLDVRVLMFAGAAGALSCFVFGLVPALFASRINLRAAADEGVRYTARSTRVRHGLVVAEVALAMLLMIGAGLLGNSFVRLLNVDPGFEVNAALAMPIEHRSLRYPESRVADFYRDLIDRLRSMPGVTAAGATTTNPLRQFGFSNSVTPEERAAEAPPSGLLQAGWRSVTPGLFDAMGIPILAGRPFTDGDRDGAQSVAIASATLAQRLWPGESPVGKRIFWGGTTGRTRTIVGVAADVRDLQLDAQPRPLLYVPHAQVDVPLLTVVIRTAAPAEQMAPAIREALRAVDGGLPAPPIYPLTESRDRATMTPRFSVSLLAAFATIALVLAVTGVYAMLAFIVSERRREMAVRVALGASASHVARLVLHSGLRLSAIGAALGIATAAGGTRLLRSLLYGVEPTDPLTFAAAAASLAAAAAVASYLPARQAARLDAAAVLKRDS
jgi:predicted permease